MTVKKDILDALWAKNDFWAKKLSRAQEELTIAYDIQAEGYKKLEEAKHNVEYYRSTREKIIAAINTIEDFVND